MSNIESLKIGRVIETYRKARNMTQTDFAKRLNTSQSAVARIEKGEQNLTTAMITKINKVLNKNIIKLASPMLDLKIEGGNELNGSVTVRSSKNSSVCLTYASVLNTEKTTLKNVSLITEINRLIDLFKSLQIEINQKDNYVEIRPKQVAKPDKIKLDCLNSWPLLIGTFSAYYDEFEIPVLSSEFNNLNVHLKSLEQLGFKFKRENDKLLIDSKNKHASEVVMYESSETATLNVIFASLFCKGQTIIKNASTGHQVQDTITYLKSIGYAIGDINPLAIVINGQPKTLGKEITYEPIADPNEALFYVATAIVTNSSFTIKNFPKYFLEVELMKLKSMGLNYLCENKKQLNGFELCDLTVQKSSLTALSEKLYSKSFPGIAIDNLPYFASIATAATGRTEIYDFITEDRIASVNLLKPLGADVLVTDSHRAFINGVKQLSGANINCTLAAHPGNMILICMLGAKGTSTLQNAYVLNSWYEGLFENLNSLGAKISVLYDF